MSTKHNRPRDGRRHIPKGVSPLERDGDPTGLGNYLTEILVSACGNDLSRMLRTLIDEHPAGWSTIVHRHFILAPP